MEPDDVEIRVLGCLIEKQRTTPDAYPLSLNALRLACNQSTNRDPVVELDEGDIREALHRMGPRRWTRLASGSSSRATKYRQMVDETLELAPDQMAVLSVLMLRGPQTPGELKQRTARIQAFADLDAVETTLVGLMERGLAVMLERRPGQKEERFAQTLGGSGVRPGGTGPVPEHVAVAVSAPAPPEPVATAWPEPSAVLPAPAAPASPAVPDERIAELRDELDALRAEHDEDLRTVRAEVRELRAALDALRAELGA